MNTDPKHWAKSFIHKKGTCIVLGCLHHLLPDLLVDPGHTEEEGGLGLLQGLQQRALHQPINNYDQYKPLL